MTTLIIFLGIAIAIGTIVRGPWFKGKLGEFTVNVGSWLFLDKSTYHRIKNVTLPTEDGTTQIDHIVVSRYGIFVTETKNMSGAIYGGEHQPRWTQAFGPKNKFKFQNPLHQNYKHTRTLAGILGVPDNVIKPIVMFIGDAKLKTKDELPPNVLDSGYTSYIRSHQDVVLDDAEVQRVLAMIEENRLTPSFKTDREHVRHVKEIVAGKQAKPSSPTRPRPGDDTDPAAIKPPTCPKCGRTMVLRTATRGKNAGNSFWGCPGYPKCRGIVKAD